MRRKKEGETLKIFPPQPSRSLDPKPEKKQCDSKTKEIDTENHMKRLSELSIARVRDDVKKLEKEEVELNDKMTSLQMGVHRGNERLDQFKLLMNWNQEELEQWALASRQKEEDNLALQKYQRADDARVKELNLAIEKMTKQVHAVKAELESEVTETQAAQIELDKTAEDFRSLHAERQELVRQWEEAVESMKRRDEAIQEASKAFALKKKEIRAKQAALDERARFLEQEINNNKEMDARIAIADRGMGKLRLVHQSEVAQQTEMQDEVEVVKNTLSKAAGDLVQTQSGNEGKGTQLEEKKKKLELVRRKLAKARQRLENEKVELMTLEERSAELARVQADNEEELAASQKEGIAHKELLFKTSQELFRLRTKERDLIAEIAGGQAQNKNMGQKILQLDAQVVRQQENLYNTEFQIQQLERKVARAGGARSDEETRVLTAKIAAITEVLDERVAEHNTITASVKRAEDDLAAARRRNLELKAFAAEITGQIGELNLEADTTAKSVRLAVKEKEDKMVAHDVLKLEVKRLRDVLNSRADQVFSLENRKFQLQLSMEERKHEVEVHRELLTAQLKMVQEDIHRATLEMKERSLKVGKLSNKYDILVARVKKDDDAPDGGEHSQAYYVIKAAQEREDLQRSGDVLDAKIRKAEKEVRALESTLGKLNEKNNVFRTSLRRADDGDMLRERGTLREKLDHAYDKMKFKRGEERALQQDLERHDARLASLADENDALHLSLRDLEDLAGRSERGLQEASARAAEMQQTLAQAQISYRQSLGLEEGVEGLEELDLKCQELREGTRVVVSELKAAASRHPELVDLLASRGIKLPGGVGSRAGSEASMGGGDAAGARTVQFQ